MAKSLGEKVVERIVLNSAGRGATKMADRVFTKLNSWLDNKEKKKTEIEKNPGSDIDETGEMEGGL